MSSVNVIDAVILIQQEILSDDFKDKLLKSALAGWNYFMFNNAVLEDNNILSWVASQLHMTITEILGSSRFHIIANMCEEGSELGISWGTSWSSIVFSSLEENLEEFPGIPGNSLDLSDDSTDIEWVDDYDIINDSSHLLHKIFNALPICEIGANVSDFYDSLVFTTASFHGLYEETGFNHIINQEIIRKISEATIDDGYNVKCIAPWPYGASLSPETQYLMELLETECKTVQPILIDTQSMCYIGISRKSILIINTEI